MHTKTKVMGDITLFDSIEMSEPGNAERLCLTAMGTIHYADTWNSWIVFRDGKWVLDSNGVGLQAIACDVPQGIFAMANALLRPPDEVFDKVKAKEKLDPEEQAAMEWYNLHITWARKSNTEPTLKRMVSLARHREGVPITTSDLDSHPYLLNLENGTFDFKTMAFKPADPGDLLTKKTKIMYDPEAQCPQWLACLEQWQPDKAVRRFLQDITGSALIGRPVQHLFVNVGAGRNGKGTFYKAIQHVLGEYAATAPEDMLVESRFRVHDEERARLRGCRMLLAPETGVGDRLDEAGIKNLTGGDLIHGRHLYGKPFDFSPTHTAFLHTNHEPQIRGTDPAIWSRVVEIPWLVTIREDQRDTQIDLKLEAESSGILNWLIEGCQRWMKTGLNKPLAIFEATEGYRVAQDQIGRFIEETFHAMVMDSNQLGPVDYIPSSIIRKHYESWCLGEGLKPWVAQSVGRELAHRGWVRSVKKVSKLATRVWQYPDSVTMGLSVPPTTRGNTTEVHRVTEDSSFFSIEERKKESKKEKEKESNIGGAVSCVPPVTDDDEQPPELTPAERDEEHRAWLREYGYPVPTMATDEEIEEYQRQQRNYRTWEQDGVMWECDASDHGPFCRLCRQVG